MRARTTSWLVAGILILALCHAGAPQTGSATEGKPSTLTFSECFGDGPSFVACNSGTGKPVLAGQSSRDFVATSEFLHAAFPRHDRARAGTEPQGFSRAGFPRLFLTGIVELRL